MDSNIEREAAHNYYLNKLDKILVKIEWVGKDLVLEFRKGEWLHNGLINAAQHRFSIGPSTIIKVEHTFFSGYLKRITFHRAGVDNESSGPSPSGGPLR